MNRTLAPVSFMNFIQSCCYEGGLISSRPNNEKNEFIISKLFLFFNIISLKTNTFIPAMLQRHYPVPVVVLPKMCEIPLYISNRLLIRRKTLTSEEEYTGPYVSAISNRYSC